MTDAEIVKTYTDEALAGIVRDLRKSRGWPERLHAARIEIQRRRATR